MIKPIKYVINNIPKIKIYVQDFPLYFNSFFRSNILIQFKAKIQLLLRCLYKDGFQVIMNIKSILGLGVKPNPNFNIIAKFKTHSLMRVRIKEKLSIIPNVVFQTKVRIFIRMFLKNSMNIIPNIKTHLAIRIKKHIHSFKLSMNIKSIVAIFYKNYERNNLTWDQVINDENINTWSKFLWKEIK